ncbi:hypothetical protein GIB67_030450 [Kingdonia uniflora]|uniref:RING-type E3 ubiquitin transferase n=1 Tax=Kingdonia uniflora TaxID=39325 RepID=A0A7J7P0H3_9MAGN|nr:hypothetical protein GIB67_035490 [Kingdonia uniflora]KAF6175232.1 hypothetical protein GIB67_030450 [Kingdonia uniflora]
MSYEIAESSTSSNIVAKATSLSDELERLMRTSPDKQLDDVVTFMQHTLSTVWEMMKLKAGLKEEFLNLGIITHDVLDEAQDIFSELKAMECSAGSVDPPLPKAFLCPLSKRLMVDPVILISGVTFERQNIQEWLDTGSQICPETKKPLGHFTDLTPNEFAKEIITQWCKNHGIVLHDPVVNISKDEKQQFNDLMLRHTKSGISEQKQAAKEMQELTLTLPQFCAHFAKEEHTISVFLSPLKVLDGDEANQELQENIIATVFNILTHDENIKAFANNPDAMPSVIKALDTRNAKTKVTAANILFNLSTYSLNRFIIGDSGGLKALLRIIEVGNDLTAMMYAIRAIFNLCMLNKNRLKAIEDGAVNVILKKVSDGAYVYELWAVLRMLSMHWNAIQEIIEHDGVRILLHNIRNSFGKLDIEILTTKSSMTENAAQQIVELDGLHMLLRNSTDKANMENCITMLDWILSNDSRTLKEFQDEERDNKTISRVVVYGNAVARKGANSILMLIIKTNVGL